VEIVAQKIVLPVTSNIVIIVKLDFTVKMVPVCKFVTQGNLIKKISVINAPQIIILMVLHVFVI
jgi:hypothetical protein